MLLDEAPHQLGAHLADAALMAGAGFHAARSGLGGRVSPDLATALGVVLPKASTDLVGVARARRGPTVADEPTRPRSQGVAAVRRPAAAFRIHRLTNGVGASLLLLAAAIGDTVTGGVDVTHWALIALAALTWV